MPARGTRATQGLRSALLRGIIPIIVIGLVASGLWSAASTWFGARLGAEAWLQGTTTSIPHLLAGLRDQSMRRLDEVSRGAPVVEGKETLLRLSPAGASELEASDLPDPALLPRVRSLAPGTHAELVSSGQRLFCIAATPTTAEGRRVLVSDVTDTVVDGFAELLSVEAVLYLGGEPVASSWRNLEGERVLAPPDPGFAEALRVPKAIESGAMSDASYRAGGYAGYALQPGELHRGQDSVPVFRALYPLQSLAGEDIGVLVGMVPKDVMMQGPKKGMYGAAFFVLLTACISVLALVRISSRQLAPLVGLTQRVRALRETVGEGLPEVEIPPPLHGGKEHELDDLARAFAELEVVASESVRLEEQAVQLERARNAALEASRLKSDFLANMSHEIRTPMNGVIGMASVLSTTALDPTQRQYVQAILRSGEDLLSVINDILDFSKIEAGKLTLTCYRFHVRECVDDVLQLLAERAADKGLDLACIVDEGVPTWVEGDPVRLRQVLVNLVGNAVKFTDRGGVTVHVAPGAEEDVIEWAVVDTGIGIAEDAQAKLFEPFTQVDGSMSRRYSGSGLGLAICRQIIEQMGGEIGVESEVGIGSRFYFTTRLAPAAAGSEPVLPRHLLESKRVLVVDDRAINRTILRRQLVHAGMQVEEAASGDTGLERLDSAFTSGHPFDLAIVDVNMHPIDGITLYRRLRGDRRFERLPVLLATSIGDARTRGFEEGTIDAILTKPIRESMLYATIRRLLGEGDGDEPVAARPSVSKHEGARVLVVEDQTINQEVATAMLQQLGLNTHVASSGEEALRLLHEDDGFDLVLMDCQMPGIDGFEAARRIRRGDVGNPDIPIIAMTAQAMKGDREACLAAGMNDYCPKPVTLERLKAVIDPWLRAAAGSGSPVDSGVLEQLGLGPEATSELRERLYRLFLEQTPEQVEAIGRAVSESDWATLASASHAMKSSCRQLGAQRLGELCEALEHAARKCVSVGPERLAAFVHEWEHARDHIERALGSRH
jgi:signal transduction histidine kinase/CheY-like chemotaxis protein